MSFYFVAIGKIEFWFWNGLAQDRLESNIDVERLEVMNILLESLGDGQITRLYANPVIGFRRALCHEEHVGDLSVDKVVVAPNVFFVDVQARRSAKKMFNLVRALHVLERLYVMNWLKWTWRLHDGLSLGQKLL
jgi:hypothetical protein